MQDQIIATPHFQPKNNSTLKHVQEEKRVDKSSGTVWIAFESGLRQLARNFQPFHSILQPTNALSECESEIRKIRSGRHILHSIARAR